MLLGELSRGLPQSSPSPSAELRVRGRQVEVHADATIAWPVIVRAVLERLERTPD